MTNPIKQLRETQGLTQRQLAEGTRLSLRTIQRVEASEKLPKGHTLKSLESFFQVEFKPERLALDKDALSRIKLINFSVLLFLFLPLLHICLPVVVWKWRKNLPSVNTCARSIINFQLQWMVAYVLLVVLSSFVQGKLNLEIPLVLFVMLALVSFNVIVVFVTAHALSTKGELPGLVRGQIQLI